MTSPLPVVGVVVDIHQHPAHCMTSACSPAGHVGRDNARPDVVHVGRDNARPGVVHVGHDNAPQAQLRRRIEAWLSDQAMDLHSLN